MAERWYENVANVLELARWLDERGELNKISDCIGLFEKPWNWAAEYEAMRAESA